MDSQDTDTARPPGSSWLSESLVRKTVWATVPFNFVAALAFAFPSSWLGQLIALPPAPPLYAAFTSFLVLSFGMMYVWLATQPRIHKPMLCFGALGKIGVFLVALALWLFNSASLPMVAASAGDLMFGSFWLVWLSGQVDH